MASDLLVGMLCAGLKATRIAHVCREKKELFEILIQEKGKLKNNVTDFKTLADVFIQQVAQNEIQEKFPPIGNKVYGEENNEFTNTLGESITVEIKPTMDETASLLARVLDGNEVASRLLAAEAHSNVQDQIEKINIKDFEQMSQISMDVENIGVWIDPIDGTAQYVGGVSQEKKDQYGVYGKGLQCVTVLIGAYNTVTGLPIMGVVYQPFFEEAETEDGIKYWKYRCFWGLSYKNAQFNNVKSLHEVNMKQRAHDMNHVIITSPHDEEAHEIIRSCENVQYCTGGGAGYKC
uniref:Uncharacterized protein n=1 Tax=Ciona savignyi TaxID=51511 RepID=H2Z9K8_CIOSA